MLKLLKILVIFVQLFLLTVYDIVGLTGDCHHTGVSVTFLAFLSIWFGITVFIFSLFFKQDGLTKAIIIIAILSGINIYILDYLNAMVEYVDWLERGQPNIFEISK